jgi:hypothetical protein
MRELSMAGVSQKFGRVHASVNYDVGRQSGGQVSAGTAYPGIADSPVVGDPTLCTMYGYMKFELPDAGVTVFNKEPIVLEHKITHIPPICQGGGTRDGVEVNLYPVDIPDGPPVAILRKVRTAIRAWLDE